MLFLFEYLLLSITIHTNIIHSNRDHSTLKRESCSAERLYKEEGGEGGQSVTQTRRLRERRRDILAAQISVGRDAIENGVAITHVSQSFDMNRKDFLVAREFLEVIQSHIFSQFKEARGELFIIHIKCIVYGREPGVKRLAMALIII